MKWISLIIFIVLFAGIGFAYPHYVSVYNSGKTSLLPASDVSVDYSLRNKYDVLYHIAENYDSVENCGVRFLKSGFSNSNMDFYGRDCITTRKPYVAKNRVFDVVVIYELNEIESW